MKNLMVFFLFVIFSCGKNPIINRSEQKSISTSQGAEHGSKETDKPYLLEKQKDAVEKPWEEKLISDVNSYLRQSGSLNDNRRPIIASTNEEIIRLKTAWASSGAEHDVLASRFSKADKAIEEGLFFPPEGGQHNQWYQCESCQIALKTIDIHHHQCPSCNKIYSGFPYDNVIYNNQHTENINRAEDAAWGWLITGDQKYLQFARDILLGYADRYLAYPMLHTTVNDKTIDVEAEKYGKYTAAGRLHAQTLTEANSLISAAITYDLVYTTLSHEEKLHIERNFIEAMAESINVHKTGKSNWQTWHNAALLYAGAVIGNGELVKQALSDKKNGFIAQMEISVMPEGMWYENSWGYHYYTLSAMTYLAEGGRRLGFDLYGFPPLQKMYFIAFDYLMNDGSLPRFGDAVQDSPFGKRVNEPAYAAYKDDRLLAVLSPEINWDGIALGRKEAGQQVLPQTKSKVVAGAGHAILATDGPGKLTAALTFAPFGGFHGHFDKLSFVWFGYGQELGVDAGRSGSQAYRLPIHREWYRATPAHNTVLVDMMSQQEADGRLLAFNSTNNYTAVAANAGSAYTNVSHNRFLLLSPNYLLIIDELKPLDEKEHTYDWLYHNNGQEIISKLPPGDFKLGTATPGYAYLEELKSYKPIKNQPIILQFIDKNINVNLNMVQEEGDQIFTATGPQKNINERVPMVMVRRKGRTVRFATVLEPVPCEGQPKVREINLNQDNPLKAIVVYDGGEDHILFPLNSLGHFIVEQRTEGGSKLLLKSQN